MVGRKPTERWFRVIFTPGEIATSQHRISVRVLMATITTVQSAETTREFETRSADLSDRTAKRSRSAHTMEVTPEAKLFECVAHQSTDRLNSNRHDHRILAAATEVKVAQVARYAISGHFEEPIYEPLRNISKIAHRIASATGRQQPFKEDEK